MIILNDRVTGTGGFVSCPFPLGGLPWLWLCYFWKQKHGKIFPLLRLRRAENSPGQLFPHREIQTPAWLQNKPSPCSKPQFCAQNYSPINNFRGENPGMLKLQQRERCGARKRFMVRLHLNLCRKQNILDKYKA